MAEERNGTRKRTGWYTAARVFGAVVLHTICPVRFVHPERLQGDAPFLVISNHSSWIDPVAIAMVIKRYETVFLGKKELVKSKLGGYVIRKLHMITVDRGNTDMEAMRACLKTLRGENVLAIFPEGTRHHEGVMEQMESGVGLIALRSGVPMFPVLIDGKIGPFRRTTVYCGEPIPMDDLRAEGVNTQTCAALMARITETYRRMLAQRGGKA